MSKLEELIEGLCPDGVEYKQLGDERYFSFHYGKGNKIPEDNGGKYDVYGANGIVSHIDEYNCEDVSIIGHIGAVGQVQRCKGKCFVTYNGTIAEPINRDLVDSQYMYYILTMLDLPSYKKGSQPFLSVSDFSKIKVPVPPLKVQREIVRILDNFTELTAELQMELQAELQARAKQYEYYRDELYSFDDSVRRVKLSEIATIIRGGNFQKKDFKENGFPCIHYGQMYTHFGISADKTLTFISDEVAAKSKIAEKNDIVMAVTSENVEDVCKCTAWIGDCDIAVSGHTAIIKHNQNAKYLSYYFHTTDFFMQKKKLAHGTKVIEVTPSALNDILIPLPSIDEQERIVALLDKFDGLVHDVSDGLPAEIEARQKQYEYYRNKLLTFKELQA